jgi:pimeloyl-ACP methyl ester carboxylesterase
MSTTFAPTNNSTPVRFCARCTWAERVAAFAIRALELGSPQLAARLGANWLFRTRRGHPHPQERDVLSLAEPLQVESPAGRVTAFRWGAGPPVLLVHGWNGRASQLGAFVPPLVSAGYQVVAFDAPGHGASAGSHSSMIAFADALDAVIAAACPFFERVHGIIAHSLGGAAVALALHRRSRHTEGEPAIDAARLVFIAPPIDPHDFSRELASAIGLGDDTRRAIDAIVEQRLGAPLDDLYGPRLARAMRTPLLVQHDLHDRVVPFAYGRMLTQAWPGAALRTTLGLGHNRILRDADSVHAAVDFIVAGTTQSPSVAADS